MKTSEAPEKIYISNFDIETLSKSEQLSERWHEVSTEDTDIEYTRTDAFIEKTCVWLEKNITGLTGVDSYAITESFKQAMKGE